MGVLHGGWSAAKAAIFGFLVVLALGCGPERASAGAPPGLEPKRVGCSAPAPSPVMHGPRSGRLVSLTFDEPLGEETAPILSILDRHGAKATFFQTGENIRSDPRLARRIVREGHELANHSYSHPSLTELSRKEIRREVLRTQRAAWRVTGFSPCLFRAPGGVHDGRVHGVLDDLGMPMVFWDTAAYEWNFRPDRIVENITRSLEPGSIVMFHQVANSRLALGPILEYMEASGLRSVPVNRLLGGRFEVRRKTRRQRCKVRRKARRAAVRRCRGRVGGRRKPVTSRGDGRVRDRD